MGLKVRRKCGIFPVTNMESETVPMPFRASRRSNAGKAVPVSPTSFAKKMLEIAACDPGCEVKAMLFKVIEKDGSETEVHFSGFETGSRCLSLVLTRKNYE